MISALLVFTETLKISCREKFPVSQKKRLSEKQVPESPSFIVSKLNDQYGASFAPYAPKSVPTPISPDNTSRMNFPVT